MYKNAFRRTSPGELTDRITGLRQRGLLLREEEGNLFLRRWTERMGREADRSKE